MFVVLGRIEVAKNKPNDGKGRQEKKLALILSLAAWLRSLWINWPCDDLFLL